jgi:hypothetical protein
LKEALISAPVI